MMTVLGAFGLKAQTETDSVSLIESENTVLADSIIDSKSQDITIVETEMAETIDYSDMFKPVKNRSIYCYPYSRTFSNGNWGRLWANTGTLVGAYVGALLVLECLPEDATAWNRAEIQNVPLFKRWRNHVLREGPEWDHDNPIFNYVLHPYAGAAYFMACRSCGFNFWQSFLYSATISTVGWEFGIEAFMERPSIQDIFITPGVGSVIGEVFYKVKRGIVADDYRLAGSKVLGNIVVFLVDPVNEALDLFRGRNTDCSNGVEVSSCIVPGRFSVAVRF